MPMVSAGAQLDVLMSNDDGNFVSVANPNDISFNAAITACEKDDSPISSDETSADGEHNQPMEKVERNSGLQTLTSVDKCVLRPPLEKDFNSQKQVEH
eukprot:10359313-Karenia_brevis.AAC.1